MVSLAQFALLTLGGALLAATIFMIRQAVEEDAQRSFGSALYRTFLTARGWLSATGLLTLATFLLSCFAPRKSGIAQMWHSLQVSLGNEPPPTVWEQWHDWAWGDFFLTYLFLMFVCVAVGMPEVVRRTWQAIEANRQRANTRGSQGPSITMAIVTAFLGSVLANMWTDRGRK